MISSHYGLLLGPSFMRLRYADLADTVASEVRAHPESRLLRRGLQELRHSETYIIHAEILTNITHSNMPATKSVDSWLEKPANGKRKRAAVVDYADSGDVSDKENIITKKAQPAKKRQTKPFTAAKPPSTAKASTAANPKESNNTKDTKKLCTETLEAIDKGIDGLDKEVEKMDPNSWMITTEDYATDAVKHVPTVHKLAAADPVLAFNVLLSVADASHTDLDATPKMCGEYDACTPMFKRMDEALLSLIDARTTPKERASELPSVPHR